MLSFIFNNIFIYCYQKTVFSYDFKLVLPNILCFTRTRRTTRFPRGCRRPRTAARAPGCQGDSESGNLGKTSRSLPPPPTPQQTPLQFEPVSPPRPQCAVRQVRIPWPTGRGSGGGRRMRAFSLPDSRATGKPWRCGDNPRAGAVSVRRPRPRLVVLATRGEGWERMELPSHAPSRSLRRSRGFPVACAHARAWDSVGVGPEDRSLFETVVVTVVFVSEE